MITDYEMYDRWFSKQSNQYQEDHAYDCPVCEYPMKKDSEYVAANGQLVNVMLCESCGHVEHWIVDSGELLECKNDKLECKDDNNKQ